MICIKKRILHLLSSNSFSGAEKVAINIIESISDEFECVYVSPFGSVKNVLDEKEITYISIEKMSIHSIRRILKSWKPDVVHAHDFRASIIVALSLYNCKKISHIHQNPSWMRTINLYTLIYSISTLFYDKIVAVSKEVFNQAIFSKLIQKKLTIISNYVDISSVAKSSNEKSNSYPYDLVFVGRLSNEKNPLRFIDIVKMISKVNPNIKAVIIGDGNLKTECKRKIISLNLENNIDILGFLNNPFPTIKNSKILIITSIYEGFGLAAVEAMSLGKPVFATPVGGIKTIFNENSEMLCNSNSEFLINILKTLNDSNYYKNLSDKSIEYSNKFSNKKTWINQINSLYN